MTWTTRILAILNIIAAFVLFYAAGRAAYQRHEWSQTLANRARQYRDGLPTEEWLGKIGNDQLGALLDRMEVTPALLARLPDSDRARIEPLERRARSNFEARKNRGDNPAPRYRSEDEQRQSIGKLTADDKVMNDPGQLLLSDQGTLKELRDRLGPAGFTRLIREAIVLNRPKILARQLDLAAKLSSILRQVETYQKDIASFDEQIARFNDRLKDEQALKDKLTFENKARRDEITQLHAEVEEALHARDVAQGRESDMRRQLAEVQDRINKLTEKNNQLEKLIETREAVTKTDR